MAFNGLLGLGGPSNPYIGLLGDTLSGVGIGLLGAQRGQTGAGIANGVQYSNQLQQQRRSNTFRDEQQKMAQQQLALAQQAAAQQQAAFAQQQQQMAMQKAAAQQMFGGPQTNQAGFRPSGAGPGSSASIASAPPSQAVAGMDPAQLQILQSMTQGGDPGGAMGLAAQQAFAKPATAPTSIQEYQYDKSQGYAGSYHDWITEKAKAGQQDASLRFGLNPVFGQDAQGRTVMMLPNTQGGVKVVQPPDGVTIAPQTQIFDTGTTGIPVDKRTGLAIPGAPVLAKDPAGVASAQAQGTAQGTAAAALPAYANSAQMALQNADDLLSDKNKTGREWATGKSAIYGAMIPGTPGYDFKVNLDKLRGGVFLQAYQQLRGGGAITEVEGTKAEQAIAAMDAAQSEPQFVTALNEYKKVIKRGLEVAQQRATAAPVAPGSNPGPGGPASGSDPLGLFSQ